MDDFPSYVVSPSLRAGSRQSPNQSSLKPFVDDSARAAEPSTKSDQAAAPWLQERSEALDTTSTYEPSQVTMTHGDGTPDIAKQHKQWVDEMHVVDGEQAELAGIQWKLMRHQTGTLTQQLVDVRKELSAIGNAQQHFGKKLDISLADFADYEKRITEFVRQSLDKLGQSLERVKKDVASETSNQLKRHDDVHKKYCALTENLRDVSCRHIPLEQELKKIRFDLKAHVSEQASLKEDLKGYRSDLKGHRSELQSSVEKATEKMNADLRERLATHEELHGQNKEMIETDMKLRDEQAASFTTLIENLRNDISRCREELPKALEKLQPLESEIARVEQEFSAQLESKIPDGQKIQAIECQLQKLQASSASMGINPHTLESRLQTLQASITAESTARKILADVFEQTVATAHSNLANMISQKVSQAEVACGALSKTMDERTRTMDERLTKERGERDSLMEAIASKHDGDKASFLHRLTIVEGRQTRVEHTVQGIVAEMRNAEARAEKSKESRDVSLHSATRAQKDKDGHDVSPHSDARAQKTRDAYNVSPRDPNRPRKFVLEDRKRCESREALHHQLRDRPQSSGANPDRSLQSRGAVPVPGRPDASR
mmetsp:Transcript_23998/g.66735  ORF Transcript_23998/g.66735 Transcript_23998/m.66735 type:complete len:605 (-) Transcript_23998:52-1866(-)